VQRCADLFKEPMAAKAKEIASTSAASALPQGGAGAGAGSARTTSGGSSGSARGPAADADDDDDDDGRPSKRDKRKDKKKKKGGGGGGGGGAGGASTDATAPTAAGEQQWNFMSLSEVEAVLANKIEGCPSEVIPELAAVLHRQLGTRFQEYVRDAFRGGVTAADRRKESEALEAE
jgi:hypothetical protein